MRRWNWLLGVVIVLGCILVLTGCISVDLGNMR